MSLFCKSMSVIRKRRYCPLRLCKKNMMHRLDSLALYVLTNQIFQQTINQKLEL